MYTLKQLELFIALARSERLIEVAKAFDISQSAISMAIRELERGLGEPLFERIGKRLVLNDRGILLLRECEPHVRGLKLIYEEFTSQKLHGELRLAASVTIADYLMPSLVSGYLQAYEGVGISLRSENSTEVLSLVKNGETDLGFIEVECNDKEIHRTTIMKDELVVVCKDAALASKGPYYIDQLAQKKWILREKGSGTRSVFLDAISPVDKELSIFMELEHTEAIKNFLLAGDDFISCLPRVSVERELKEKKLFEIGIRAVAFEREFIMISRRERSESTLLKHFKAYAMQTYA
jgi:DNA-binding transcriptional LysR family regulator